MINNLSTYRRKAHLTQIEFAAALGVGTATLSKWENPNFDLKKLSVNIILAICNLLNITFKDLISINGEERKNESKL